MLRKGSALSGVLIIVGLVLALWWMHSAEEQVTISHKLRVANSSIQTFPHSRTPATTPEIPTLRSKMSKSKMKELQQILDSKNDNDPRLDKDFKILSGEEKKAFEERYLAYSPEKLNERGTLAFLIGRNINSKEDIHFLNQILEEPPCQSLANCNVTSPKATGEAVHEESLNDVTLAYPQIVVIKSLENILFRTDITDPNLKSLAVGSLTQATHSKSAVVASLARQTLKKIAP